MAAVCIVSRADWGAAKPVKSTTLKGPAETVIIHHTAVAKCQSLKECMGQLVSIQSDHMKNRSFDDIGYNFLVGGDGTLFEGRGWGVVGAHAKGHNDNSLGIAFMGNYNNDEVSSEAISSVKKLLQVGVSNKHLDEKYVVKGHKDLGQTECPGTKLYAALPQLRSTC